jgi:hypothetical protein
VICPSLHPNCIAYGPPLGSISAPTVSRLIFMYFAPEIKVRLYRRLLLRFLSQLGALFSPYRNLLLHQHSRLVARERVRVFQSSCRLADKHCSLSARSDASPIAINRSATAFLYYTLMFLMFVAIYVMSSLFRVLRFVLRRWRVLLR